VLSRRNTVLQSAAILLTQVLDWATTTLALKHGGEEGNPLVLALIERGGTDLLLAVKFAVAAVFILVCARSRRGQTIAWILVLMFGGVALWNLRALEILLSATHP